MSDNLAPMTSERRTRALAVCVLLALIHTWPLAMHPGRYSRNDNADTQLNEWILAWVEHELPRAPLHLFEANIFYPAHDALAFSEPLIVPALLGAPIAWSGGSPVLVYNLVLIAGFALTAFATFLLVESWTGSFFAGLLAGSAFAFNTHTLTRLPHIQGIHIYSLPLVLLAADTLLREGSWKAGAALVGGLALAAYTSGYLIVFAAVMLAIFGVATLPVWRPQWRFVGPRTAAALALSALVLVPIYLPYHRAATEQHMLRSLDLVKEYSATPRGFLASAGRIHFSTWSGRFFKDPVDSFFPGFTLIVLAAMALLRRHESGVSRWRIVGVGAFAAAGAVLALGTATPFYGWLYHVFPPMQGLRAAARFGNLFLLGMAILAGYGAAGIRRPAVAIALIVLVNAEALRAPFTYQPFAGIPSVYALLRDEPGPVVVAEQPFYPPWAVFLNGSYVLNSTAHWRPLMNGYSGYTPDTYHQYANAFWYFPQEWAIKAMKDAGVTHVVVHPAAFRRDHQEVVPLLDARSDFELLGIGADDVRLYRLKR
ncbi:MAG TPA: hypothetical protein VGI12_19055 [Vicinamibacterales bacterium]